MPPVRIDVASASRTYPVLVAPGLISNLETHLSAAGIGARRFVVSSPNVWRRHGETIATALPGTPHLLIPDGERSKNQQTLGRIYEWLIGAGADRHSVVIAVGGGVIGDTVGFGAASYLRGVDLVQVPTTLLAQVDSSIGGKVGINHALGKNLIGAFHQPRLVLIDPSTLNTLPEREFRAGMAEVIKYGILGDTALFEELEACPDPSTPAGLGSERLSSILQRSAAAKARVVAADEKEGGLRAILNYGHTFGHVVETLCGYGTWLHGEAVAIGMVAVGELAVLRGSWNREDAERQRRLIHSAGLPTAWPDLAADAVLDSLQGDKKVRDGRLRFVMPTSIGTVEIRDDVSRDEILSCLERLKG